MSCMAIASTEDILQMEEEICATVATHSSVILTFITRWSPLDLLCLSPHFRLPSLVWWPSTRHSANRTEDQAVHKATPVRIFVLLGDCEEISQGKKPSYHPLRYGATPISGGQVPTCTCISGYTCHNVVSRPTSLDNVGTSETCCQTLPRAPP